VPVTPDALAAEHACHVTTSDRETGGPRVTEAWFALDGDRLYALAEGGGLAPWVRDLLRDADVSLRVGERALRGGARVLDPGPEVEHARRLLIAKYAAAGEEDVSYHVRAGQPVRIDLRGPGAPRRAR